MSDPTHAAESEKAVAADDTPDGSPRQTIIIRIVGALLLIAVTIWIAVGLVTVDSGDPAQRGIDEKVTTVGSVEVTGRLIEIRGKFLPNDGLYNYAFVMKYEVLDVHRGEIDATQIAVAHYNPLKPRPRVADEFLPSVGGNLKKFRAKDVHRMALEVPVDDHYIGGIVDRYFDEEKGEIYWAVWTNLAN